MKISDLFEFVEPIPCFYHGSTIPNLKVLKRQPSKLMRKTREGKNGVVFAATMPEIAIAMSGHWSDDDFSFGHQTNSKHPDLKFPPYDMKELKAGAFEKFFNQPIYLYEVPANYFKPSDNLQDFELISYKDVPIHTFIKFDDPLAYLSASPIIHLIYNVEEMHTLKQTLAAPTMVNTRAVLPPTIPGT